MVKFTHLHQFSIKIPCDFLLISVFFLFDSLPCGFVSVLACCLLLPAVTTSLTLKLPSMTTSLSFPLLSLMHAAIFAVHPMSISFVPSSHCERVTCEFTRDPASCLLLPLRISFYNISFPTNTPVPTDVFRMGPSNSVPGDKILVDIVSGDEEGYFIVQQHANGGEISLHRALSQPRDFFLTVEMRLIRYGTTHLYMAKIAVFVTHELSIRPSRIFPY